MFCKISVDIRSWSDSFPESMASISSFLSSGGITESSSDLSPLFASLRFLVHIFPSLDCVNVIISPVCSLEDVAQGVYVTAGRIAIASEEGCDGYYNSIEKMSSKTTSYEDIIFLSLGTHTRYNFWCFGIPINIPRKPCCAW